MEASVAAYSYTLPILLLCSFKCRFNMIHNGFSITEPFYSQCRLDSATTLAAQIICPLASASSRV